MRMRIKLATPALRRKDHTIKSAHLILILPLQYLSPECSTPTNRESRLMAPRFGSFNFARKASSPSVWAYALFMLLGGIMAATFLFLGSILLMILTPIVIIAALILRWRLKRFLRTAASNQDKSVIDAEYTVIEERRRP